MSNKGMFIKGHVGFWKGKKRSPESIEKHRQSMLGKPHPMPEGFVPWNKGLKLGYVPVGAFKKGMIPWNKGKVCPQFHGANGGGWKGGVTALYDQIRNSTQMRQWKSDIYTRDKFTCQHCGDNQGGNLNAHHIMAFSLILQKHEITSMEQAIKCEELWNINNGITLCEKCHIKIHYYKKERKVA
jgi:hypothetical protein